MGGNEMVVAFVVGFAVVSIVITWWTSRSTKSASDFYVAGKGIPWIQVGIAMVGSYLSAASFLGCPGDIGVFGIDSIWLSIGFFGGYMALLLLIAGPLRNVGSFTVAGALGRRFPSDRLKLMIMICTIVISTFYLVPQMLGAGLLFEMLLGWDFIAVTIGLGFLMSVYIIFGGMKSTLYNQVIQALFLWVCMVVLTVLAFFSVGKGSFNYILSTAQQTVPPHIAGKDKALVEEIKSKAIAELPVSDAIAMAKTIMGTKAPENPVDTRDLLRKLGNDDPAKKVRDAIEWEALDRFSPERAIEMSRAKMPDAPDTMTIGVKSTSFLAMISTVIALVFGTAGLPHILIMFFTVPNASAAKKSVTLCIVALGIFYICAIILGFLLFPGIYPKLLAWLGSGNVGLAKNMSVLEIGENVGGKMLMAIGAAGAIAAILSTSAGLMITVAGTVSNDLYKVYINRSATEKQELLIARITTITMSAIAVVLAVMLKKQNIAWLVMLAFSIAASSIFPAMLATLWWKRASLQGLIASIATGLAISVLFVVLLLLEIPSFLGLPTSGGPGIFGVSLASIVLVVVSLLTKNKGPEAEKFLETAHREDN